MQYILSSFEKIRRQIISARELGCIQLNAPGIARRQSYERLRPLYLLFQISANLCMLAGYWTGYPWSLSNTGMEPVCGFWTHSERAFGYRVLAFRAYFGGFGLDQGCRPPSLLSEAWEVIQHAHGMVLVRERDPSKLQVSGLGLETVSCVLGQRKPPILQVSLLHSLFKLSALHAVLIVIFGTLEFLLASDRWFFVGGLSTRTTLTSLKLQRSNTTSVKATITRRH